MVGVERVSSLSPVHLIPLTPVAGMCVLECILADFLPPVVTLNQLTCPLGTRVSCEGGVMMTPNYPLLEGCVRRNPHSVFVHPKSLHGFQLVTSYFSRVILLGCGFYLFF